MTTIKSQNYKVWRHLRLIGPLTQMQALRRYGVMRLGARVHNLRSMGAHIETETIAVKCSGGRVAHVARYRLTVKK